jgi:hypothetical protein
VRCAHAQGEEEGRAALLLMPKKTFLILSRALRARVEGRRMDMQ